MWGWSGWELHWSGLVLWAGCFEGCWLLLVVLCPLVRVLVEGVGSFVYEVQSSITKESAQQ